MERWRDEREEGRKRRMRKSRRGKEVTIKTENKRSFSSQWWLMLIGSLSPALIGRLNCEQGPPIGKGQGRATPHRQRLTPIQPPTPNKCPRNIVTRNNRSLGRVSASSFISACRRGFWRTGLDWTHPFDGDDEDGRSDGTRVDPVPPAILVDPHGDAQDSKHGHAGTLRLLEVGQC